MLSLAACAGPRLPGPNTPEVHYDAKDRAVLVIVSGLRPASDAALVSRQGLRHPAPTISLVSGPHVLYNRPPSVSLGIGGFGLSGCCSGFGSGLSVGLPVGPPTPAEVSNQYVALALIPVPADYAANWVSYHLQVSVGPRVEKGAGCPVPAAACRTTCLEMLKAMDGRLPHSQWKRCIPAYDVLIKRASRSVYSNVLYWI